MKRLLCALLMMSALAWGVVGPNTDAYDRKWSDNIGTIYGTDNDFALRYNSVSGNWECKNAAGTILLYVTPAGKVVITDSFSIGSAKTYQINGTQITSAALSNDTNLTKNNSAQITGGAIDGATVGASTASTGRFTSLTTTTGTISIPTGQVYKINGTQITTAALSDSANIALLDQISKFTAGLDIASGQTYKINGTQISSAALSNDANIAKLNQTAKFSTGLDINSGQTYKINGTQITSAALSDNANVAKLNGTNTWTGAQTFTGGATYDGDLNLTSGHVYKISDSQISTLSLSDASTIVKTSGDQSISGVKEFTTVPNITSGTAGTMEVNANASPSGNSTANIIAFAATAQAIGSFTGGNFTGVYGVAEPPSNGTSGNLIGGKFLADVSDISSHPAMYGLYSQINDVSGGASPASAMGLYVDFPSTLASTANYGIKVDDIVGGTSNYSIYTGTGIAHFGDNVDLASGKVYKINGSQIASANLSDTAKVVLTDTAQTVSATKNFTAKQGFGTASPGEAIHVYNNTAATQIYALVENAASGTSSGIRIKNTAAEWAFYNAGTTGIASIRNWGGGWDGLKIDPATAMVTCFRGITSGSSGLGLTDSVGNLLTASLKTSGTSDNKVIRSDGTNIFTTTTGARTLDFDVANITPATTNGCGAAAADANDNWGATFTAGQIGYWTIPQLPSDFDNSLETLNVMWSQATTAGAVTWSINAIVFADGTAENQAQGTYTDAGADTPGAVDQRQITAISASTLFGASASKAAKVYVKCKTIAAGGTVTLRGVHMEF